MEVVNELCSLGSLNCCDLHSFNFKTVTWLLSETEPDRNLESEVRRVRRLDM